MFAKPDTRYTKFMDTLKSRINAHTELEGGHQLSRRFVPDNTIALTLNVYDSEC